MSYRIDYSSTGKQRGKAGVRLRLTVLTVLFFFLFLLLVNTMWEEGADLLHCFVLSVKVSPALAALEHFAEDFLFGKSVSEAFSDFCEILIP